MSRKKQARKANPFLDLEAEEDSRDEDSEEEDGDFDDIFAEDTAGEPFLDPGPTHRTEALSDDNPLALEAIADQYKVRTQHRVASSWRKRVTPVEHQGEGMPAAAIGNGRRADVVEHIRCSATRVGMGGEKPPTISEVFSVPSLRGLVYIEALSSLDVQNAVGGHSGVNPLDAIWLVPIEEHSQVYMLKTRPNSDVDFATGQWVHIRRGPYAKDLALMSAIPCKETPSNGDILPFLDALNQGLPFHGGLVAQILTAEVQEALRHGDHVRIVSGEQSGLWGTFGHAQDGMAIVAVEASIIPGLLPSSHREDEDEDAPVTEFIVPLSLICPYFRPGDHVKVRHEDQTGIMFAVDDVSSSVSFIETATQNTLLNEVLASGQNLCDHVDFHSLELAVACARVPDPSLIRKCLQEGSI
ncbi:hypothetical protein EW146_g7962 [Bondarzewia mesenterica]|uniref:NGN domain-containing protein n=1 Tax=Bondarzewia mesenterica TaxID=1095465 RepID=A0A4S4LNN5_9AGAM|nr:hypothetical protein EW146_g7962 [Bondarzewia mesenterica]